MKRLMNEYVDYYREHRTHLALTKGTQAGREAADGTESGCRIVTIPRLGGWHHRYNLAA
jgi:hypothetical protein